MASTRTAERWLLCAVLLAGCGLRSSSVATRPAGQVRDAVSDAGLEPDAMNAVDIGQVDQRKAASATGGSSGSWGSIDCEGTEEQVNDCIINAPTKSGISATRSKPTLTYQTCGAQ